MSRGNGALFPETPWEILLRRERARRRQRELALSEFCRLYWKPVFGVLLARRIEPFEAQDLTQGFFLHLIQSDAIARVDRRKGRFRDFLTGALNHYLIDRRKQAQTLKRGGAAIVLSLDEPGLAETVPLADERETDCAQCDRLWANSLLAPALEVTERQWALGNRAGTFHLLKPYLTGAEPPSYERLARRMGPSPATLRSDVKRLREKFRANVREELRRSVGEKRLEQEWEILREILRHNCDL